jgi:hypothetical protein
LANASVNFAKLRIVSAMPASKASEPEFTGRTGEQIFGSFIPSLYNVSFILGFRSPYWSPCLAEEV